MHRFLTALRDQRTRGLIYRTLVSLGSVAVLYGLLSEQEVAVWLGLIAQVLNVLGNGLAAANTPINKE